MSPGRVATAPDGTSGSGCEVISVADLVPVKRGSVVPREEGSAPRAQPQAYSPFAEFDEMWNRMVSRFFGASLAWPEWAQEWTPPVDVEETDDAWVFEIELPGAQRDDIQVEVGDTELVISGTVGERERTGVVRRRARRSGSFEYRTSLPAGVDPDKIDAGFDNGLLTVRVPRPERAKRRRIKIN
jgi:HSP20 family protein